MIITNPVNERTSIKVTVTFLDEDKQLVVPDAATVRIDDLSSREVIRATASLSGLESSMEIAISSEENRILGEAEFETRVLTIEFDYGEDKHGTAELRYQIRNLIGVSAP